MIWLANILELAGAVTLVIAAIGVVVLPDALSRQHAATKAATVALTLIVFGVMMESVPWGTMVRLVAIIVLLFMTVPLASHVMARAAVREAGLDTEVDEAPRAEDAVPPDSRT